MEKTYEIHDLGCAHCGGKIEEAINALEEVESAVLNFPMRKLRVKGELTDDLLEKMNQIAGKIESGVTISEPNSRKNFTAEKTYEIHDLGCAHCGGKIEEAINALEEVESAVLNFPMGKLRVKGELTSELLDKMNQIAGQIEPGVTISEPDSHDHDHDHEHSHEDECDCHEHEHNHGHSHEEGGLKKELPLLIGGIAAFAAALALHHFTDLSIVSIIPFAAAYLLLGYNVLTATVKNVSKGNFFDENFLMTIATLGAFVLGEYAEAVGVVLFFKIGELFEDYAVAKSRKAITDTASLRVDEAEVLREGEFVVIDADKIEVGDILRIKTGQRIAADGVVVSGESRIDTSAVNGEPVPVAVRPGDEVMSGCINTSSAFTLRATAAAADSMISKIARAVEEASAGKPQIDRFITRFSKIYTPFVIAAAVLTAVIGTLVTHDWEKWIYSALTFLVISCPCALVLSVPLAYFSGIGASSKLGILFKGGASLEALGKVKSIIFDKTGTLTNGSFTVTDVKICGRLDENELIGICASCEKVSTHPVALSIVSAAEQRGLTLTEPASSDELAGRGLCAKINGDSVICGNERLMSEKGISLPDMSAADMGSVVYVAVNGEIQGRIVVSDSIRKTSARSVAELRAMNIHTVMLTGDKPENAAAAGKILGIDEAHGGLMPDGKLRELNRIREEKGAVMFVGDGINDAPVLAGADVGGAMQNGADLALEASDAVFMNSEPSSVVTAKKIADKTLRISYQNIAFALAIKAIVLILGITGHPNMWLAVFADSGTAMLLILNSIRVLNTKKYR